MRKCLPRLLRQILLICLISGCLNAAAQTRISGTIRDAATSEPLAGVSLLLVHADKAASTNQNGEYAMLGVQPNDTLVATYIGYIEQRIPLNGRFVIDLSLEQEAENLNNVVVVGYGTQKKVNVTGAVATIQAKDIENRPITNIAQALQGQVPGLTVTQNSGQPGAESIGLKIRGTSTFTSNDPLVIVDGIAISLASLNLNDIESVSVLKDAAATAIYGARASGGVILVTTKKGKSGKARVSYDGYYGIQSPTRIPDQVNAYQHATIYNQAQLNDNPNATNLRFSAADIEKWRTGEVPSAYRLDYLFNPAPITQQNLSISGGTDKSTYYVSLGYLLQEGVMRNTDFERFNIRVSNTFKVGERLEIGVMAQFAPTNRGSVSVASYPSGPTRGVNDIIFEAYRRGSVFPIFTSDGRWASVTSFANRIGLGSADGGFQNSKFNRFTGSLDLKLDLAKGLTLNGIYGGKYDQTRTVNFSKRMQFISPIDPNKVDFDYNINSLLTGNQTNYQHNLQLLLNYVKQLGDHDIKFLGGVTEEWNENFEEELGRRDFLTDDIYVINAGNADPATWTTSGAAEEWAIRSFFGRVNYSYNNRYLFESNLRYDGSSRFAEQRQWGLFPSFSAGWRISEEPFFHSGKLINELKLRASWGQVGNQNVGLYQYASTIGTGAYYFNSLPNTSAFYRGSPNRNLTWETKTTANIGIDASFFNNKLSLTADVFKDRTSDILLALPVPDTYGNAPPVQNAGVVDNKGWEVSVTHRNTIGSFTYSVTAQVSDAREKVVDLAGTGPFISGNFITDVGYSLNEWYGWEAEGLFQSVEEVQRHSFQNNQTGPGDIRYKEQGGDPATISADDRVRLGYSLPRYPFGVNIQLGWKDFDLSAFGQGVGYRLSYLSSLAGDPILDENASAFTFQTDAWSPENTDARFPKYRLSALNKAFSSFKLQNSAYFRLKNVQLGYTLPSALSNRLRLSRARIYFSGENLFTITKFLGYDPEIPNGSGGIYPLTRISTLGLSISF